MTTHTPLSNDSVLWRVLMMTPSGHVEMVEVRSPSAAMALATVQDWKPYHQVATDPSGNPRISGGPRASP